MLLLLLLGVHHELLSLLLHRGLSWLASWFTCKLTCYSVLVSVPSLIRFFNQHYLYSKSFLVQKAANQSLDTVLCKTRMSL